MRYIDSSESYGWLFPDRLIDIDIAQPIICTNRFVQNKQLYIIYISTIMQYKFIFYLRKHIKNLH